MFVSFGLCISETEGHLLAGFMEGECHLGIVERNGGDSMACALRVNVRDDDHEMLEWIAAATGVGSLCRVRARRSSKPQVAWTIQRHDECEEICRFLRRFPFFGRKQRELALWSRAVRLGPKNQELRELKQRLEAVRAFGPAVDVVARPHCPAALKGYITGFVAAEGSFGLYADQPRVTVHLRADDRPLLDMLAQESGLGTVHSCAAPPPLNPSCNWVVCRQAHTQVLTEWLLEADLYGRKRAELDAWAAAVDETRRAGLASRKRDPAIMAAAQERLAAARAYVPTPFGERLDVARLAPREAGLALLRQWAGEEIGPLTSSAYMRWRETRSVAPHRNTIVRRFGSWHAALAAAGLQDRAGSTADVVAARRVAAEPGLRRRREAARIVALDAVARCRDDLGATPRVIDYQRWRLQLGDAGPNHGVFYRLFSGGWEGVLTALAAREASAGR